MQATERDGSPWSCLSASILRREAPEFGPLWHGRDWTPKTILSKPHGTPMARSHGMSKGT